MESDASRAREANRVDTTKAREPGPASAAGYRTISYWMDSVGEELAARPALAGDLDVDVAVVGAGYTGLWTAYYLATHSPSTRVAVVEREVAGYGASGRNGGWCSALFAVSDAALAQQFGHGPMRAMRQAMRDTVDEVGRVVAAEGIDCAFRKEGTVTASRSAAQSAALLAELAEARELGVGEDDLRWHEAGEAKTLLNASGVSGALFTPHCAAVHPARLVRGLAAAAERRGVTIYEKTEAVEILGAGEGRARPALFTRHGTVTADVVVVATEGYTARLSGFGRDVVPIYSLMVATEPLGDDRVRELGAALAKGATFTDGRHLIIYGQVTADGRLAFGGRGAPYHYGSQIRPAFDRDERVHASLAADIAELFPQLGPVEITHRWGGPIGVHRDWFPTVQLDRSRGIARAGGYVGDGVGTTNLAGRTLADLILERESDLLALSWVGRPTRRWEPEPLRFFGVNAGLIAMQVADSLETRTGRPSRLASVVNKLIGH